MFDQAVERGLNTASKFSAPAATAAKWLVIAGIAYTIATTALFFIAGSEAPATLGQATPARSTAPARPVNIPAIIERHLFGVADAEPEAEQETVTAVTRLPLELQAVFVAGDGEDSDRSTAIIAERGKPGTLYEIGERISGAELVAVRADHVVLSRAGARERLNFPEQQSQFEVGEQTELDARQTGGRVLPSTDTRNPPESAREIVEAYQEQLQEDPEALLDQLGVEENEGQGYRLGALARAPYLSQAGLQPGDVILSVNGQPVGDVDADRARLAQVLEQGSAEIEIQRGSRRFVVKTSLK